MTVAIIILAFALVSALVILAVINYNQMLMVNEVNKRLLLLAQESIERERVTKEEQQDALIQLAVATEINATQELSRAPTVSQDEDDEEDINFFSDTNY
jgi:hypothetical protein